jgi:uncharacterized protein (DUF2225 family)
MKDEDREVKVSFQSKEESRCPVCDTVFHREEPLTGGGRLIAGTLTEELHRMYEPSAKYGEVFPLAYVITVCPECWFSSADKDFSALPGDAKGRAIDDRERRVADTLRAFPGTDFRENRGLINGAASHYLALRCYDFYTKEFSPTIKQGIEALRTGWLLDEMDRKYPGQHFDWLAVLFKKKSQFFYIEAIKREQSGQETLSGIKFFGPDTDKNYAYEGALYLSGLLQLKYGVQDSSGRAASLEEAKRTIAKIFGLGRSSKSKPGPLLEHARNLYDAINRELNETDE